LKPFPLIRLWLAVAALTTAGAFIFAYRSIRQSELSNAGVDHTQQTLTTLVSLEAATGDLIFASSDAAIDRAAAAARQRVDDLATVTPGNQQSRLQALRREIDSVVQTRHGGSGHDASSRAEAVVPQSLSRLLRDLRADELKHLTDHVTDDTRTSRRLRKILAMVTAGSATLLVWVFGLVVRDERKRREVETILRRANEELDSRVSTRTAELNEALSREQSLRHDAESSNRLKDEFLMTVSHELRTPLNALLGWADMLRLGIVPPDRQARAVDAIYDNARRQNQLIGDLLDTARILTGKLRIEPVAVDLAQIVRDAVAVVAPAAEAKGLRLEVDIDPGMGALVGDPGRLQQIVWNLVSNAVKFTPQGTVSVRAGLTDAGRNVQIAVADTGQGIHHDFLPHVFERFRQEKTGTTRPHSGLGLGLAIVRQLVELHGGTIRADSDGEGRGATFTVNLPAARRDALDRALPGDAATPAQPNDMPSLDGVRVLVVDDDVAAREMVTAALTHCGARVASAASAAEARSALAENGCHVLLVDIAMPGEDGYALMRDLRIRGLRLPAAALTAQAHDADRVRALNAGFTVHISKPIGARDLADAVAGLARGASAPS